MQLDVASNVARQSLIASQFQIALSSRNVAAANDPDRSRAAATLASTIDGGVRVASVRRAEDAAIFARLISATAATAERDAVLTQLNNLSQSIDDPAFGQSIGALVGDLKSAVADYANAPDDTLLGRTVIERARDVADKLNRTTSDLLVMRAQTDLAVADSVDTVNRLLVEYDEINEAVVKATAAGRDATMDMDRRDGIVKEIAEHLGVTTMRRDNNDLALFTDGGVTLYDRGPRSVEFQRTAIYTAGTLGGDVFVDGLAVTGPDAVMPSTTGKIVGNITVRDSVLPTHQLQMDEIARELTDIFTDGPGSLFITAGPPDYAGTIEVAAAVDPNQGGAVEALRDGTGNPSGFAAYGDRLLQLGEALEAVATFDPAAELDSSVSVLGFSTQSAGWVEALRQTVQTQTDAEAAILTQTSNALSRETGVNLDDEYAQQLQIERSFAASSRLISIIDEMFDELLRIA